MNIYPAYISKHNLNHSFKGSNRERWHYLAAKKIPVLLKGITSGDFYCLNCLHSEQKTNSNLIKSYVKIKIFTVL